jgi:Tol biopolymer transport system component/DNA-binding winged helix-turn-helix (wHTH) protein
MSVHATRTRFGDFELDPGTGTLLRDGRRVRIQPQPLRVLAYLVDRAGAAVTRDELRQAIWDQATFVEFDQGLNYCIRQVRQALGDEATKPVFIETLKKRGYIFIAPVERVGPAAATPEPVLGDEPVAPPAMTEPVGRSWTRLAIYPALAVAVVALVAVLVLVRQRPQPRTYTQVTTFNDAAFSPAVSPDGRTIAFIVGSDVGFPYTGEIYTKMLPGGEPVQRTHDGWPKYGVAFSPDGSQITYTVGEPRHGWSTSSLAALGGDSRLLLPNAAGLSWLDNEHALFSEIKSGLHMGLVTATTNRADVRDIYLPKHERGMAHYAYASPDRSNILVVEMGPDGGWERCRLVPFDGRSAGSLVGPAGACTSAAWSPDGAWMYFTVWANRGSHLWRQRFPGGEPEQLTFGPLEEVGLAVNPDGRSLLTSAGILESGAWMHDASGNRLVSPEGYAWLLSFSRDGHRLYYVLQRERGGSGELWTTDLASGKSDAVVTGLSIGGYDVSLDGSQVVFAARTPEGVSQIWVAPCDGQAKPHLLAGAGESEPFFGPDGDVLFRVSDGAESHLFAMKLDGSQRRQVLDDPILNIKGVSADRKLVVVMMPVNEVPTSAVFAVSVRDGSMTRICPANCLAEWSPDGSRFYVEPFLQGADAGKALEIPVDRAESMPHLPSYGVRTVADAAAIRGSTVIDMSPFDPGHAGAFVAPGLSKGTFAFTRSISHRNLFQLSLP